MSLRKINSTTADIVTRRTSFKKRSCNAHRAEGFTRVVSSRFFRALSRSEEIYCRELLNTEDVDEGVRAFLEKRKPDWKHR